MTTQWMVKHDHWPSPGSSWLCCLRQHAYVRVKAQVKMWLAAIYNNLSHISSHFRIWLQRRLIISQMEINTLSLSLIELLRFFIYLSASSWYSAAWEENYFGKSIYFVCQHNSSVSLLMLIAQEDAWLSSAMTQLKQSFSRSLCALRDTMSHFINPVQYPNLHQLYPFWPTISISMFDMNVSVSVISHGSNRR